MNPSLDRRHLALKILIDVFINRQNTDQAFANHLPEDPQARSWIKALCFGVLRKRSIFDCLIKRFATKKIPDRDFILQLILYIGFYQLFYMDIKKHAALFETVELSKHWHMTHAKGFINALLQKAVRAGSSLLQELPKEAHYNHPLWLIQMLKAAYPECWQNIIAENNLEPPLYLRINARQTPRADYIKMLENNEYTGYSLPSLSDLAIELLTPVDVKTLPGFGTGFFSVQDLAAQQAALLLELADDQIVLDACAAPGGKSCHILECADVRLIANDQDEGRLQKVRENLFRLNLKAELSVTNALHLDYPPQFFDRILLDAPCSATGVIRRHPDITLLRKENDIRTLSALQLQLLKHLGPMLKSGGILLYATCSVLPAENDDVIHHFLKDNSCFQMIPIDFNHGRQTQYGWQFLPQPHGPDGFYYAKMRKT